jgi:hypothetical protein
MLLTDTQVNASKRAQNQPYTFLCWSKGMGKTLVCMHAMIERSLNIRGNESVYIFPDYSDRSYVIDFSLQVLDRTFKMNAQVSQYTLNFGNGSKIRFIDAAGFIVEPFSYDLVVLDDTHRIDCDTPLYAELFLRAERTSRGREDIKRVLEARLSGC